MAAVPEGVGADTDDDEVAYSRGITSTWIDESIFRFGLAWGAAGGGRRSCRGACCGGGAGDPAVGGPGCRGAAVGDVSGDREDSGAHDPGRRGGRLDKTKPARPLAGRAEIGDLGRFASRKKLAAYALLAPRSQDGGEETGATPAGRHVGHQGCRTLKWAFLEAAHGAVRKSAWMAAGFDRRTDGGRRDKNRGYLAVARPLCEIGYACQRKGVDCME